MVINSRSSTEYLHTDVILSKITEYDIFVYYCPNFKVIGKKFISDIRNDSSPTVYITMYNGKLLYKDFGNSEHTFDCFNYIKYKYNCSFMEALTIIDHDFNLKLSSIVQDKKFTMGTIAYKHKDMPKISKKDVIIRKKSRSWNKDDIHFWSKYFITKKILTKFYVEPISYFWINEARFTCKSISYIFIFKNRYKVYSPYDNTVKWLSNTNKTDIQGFNQLPETGERLIITSSLKDVMCLYAAGYNAIAMQSEMQIPDEKLINKLKQRFKVLNVLYDNDFQKENNPGQTIAIKICTLYNLTNICIPEKFEAKDPSDLVSKMGDFNELKNILNETKT